MIVSATTTEEEFKEAVKAIGVKLDLSEEDLIEVYQHVSSLIFYCLV
jgi:hypothetical protein